MNNETNPLVSFLISLKQKEDRASLAKLKRGASDPYNNFEVLSIIGRYLPDNQDDTFRNSMLLATLFAIHPQHSKDCNLGAALRKVRLSLQLGQESLDSRFALMLNSDKEDLPHHLLQNLRFIANKDIGIDYDILFKDLKFWNHPDKFVQLSWAKEYWGKFEKHEEKVETIEN